MGRIHDVSYAITCIRKALREACSQKPMELVALSGGLDSTIVAWHARQKGRTAGIATISEDFVAPDLAYCQMAASDLDIPLTISSAGTDEVLGEVTETIRILRNFNDIEIRNSVVMYHAARWAAENGYDTLATGDGADELFAGYRFLTEMPEDRVASEIDRVCDTMHFTSREIGRALGISMFSPFLDERVVRVARDVDAGLKIREERVGASSDRHPHGASGDARQDPGSASGDSPTGTRYGKWILRKSFENDIPYRIAWRTKSAMQDGSGTAGLTAMFDSIMNMSKTPYAEAVQRIKEEDDVTIRSCESLYYYKIFRKMFGRPADVQSADAVDGDGGGSSDDDGTDVPEPSSDHVKRCPYCMCVTAGSSRFCRMCAAFPI